MSLLITTRRRSTTTCILCSTSTRNPLASVLSRLVGFPSSRSASIAGRVELGESQPRRWYAPHTQRSEGVHCSWLHTRDRVSRGISSEARVHKDGPLTGHQDKLMSSLRRVPTAPSPSPTEAFFCSSPRSRFSGRHVYYGYNQPRRLGASLAQCFGNSGSRASRLASSFGGSVSAGLRCALPREDRHASGGLNELKPLARQEHLCTMTPCQWMMPRSILVSLWTCLFPVF